MQEEADELYGLALEEFTGARDALAKRLKADKRREDADAVSALRKPSVAAWAINQAVRGHRAEADALLGAGAGLREAHEAMLGGGDAAAVRAASERERDAVRALTRRALDALGERASEATAEKIRATLHAVAADEALREQVEDGTLQRESDGGATGWPAIGDEVEIAEGESRPRRAERGGDRSSSKLPKSGERSERRSKRRPTGLSDAERRHRDAAQRAQREADHAQEAEADAEAAAQSARETLADAEQASRDARELAEQAEADERAARRAMKEAEAQTERRKTEARRAVKAAKARS